jgi:hypothetical protein
MEQGSSAALWGVCLLLSALLASLAGWTLRLSRRLSQLERVDQPPAAPLKQDAPATRRQRKRKRQGLNQSERQKSVSDWVVHNLKLSLGPPAGPLSLASLPAPYAPSSPPLSPSEQVFGAKALAAKLFEFASIPVGADICQQGLVSELFPWVPACRLFIGDRCVCCRRAREPREARTSSQSSDKLAEMCLDRFTRWEAGYVARRRTAFPWNAKYIGGSTGMAGFAREAWFKLDFMSGKRVWDCNYVIQQAFRNGNRIRYEHEAELLEREQQLRARAEAETQSKKQERGAAEASSFEAKRSTAVSRVEDRIRALEDYWREKEVGRALYV